MKFLHGVHSVNDLVQKVKENQNQFLLALGLSVLLIGGLFGYSYHKQNKEEKAYRSLVVGLEYFNAPVKVDSQEKEDDFSFLGKKEFKTDAEKWTKVESVFASAYKDHAGSGLASMFLIYRSQALIELNRKPDAVNALRLAVKQMSSTTVASYFKVKLALMLIDTKNKTFVEEGLSLLKAIAQSDSSISHDAALYSLGEYYWYMKQFQEAKNYWNQLLLKYAKSTEAPSPWVPVAKEKLRLIDSDVD